MMAPLSSKSFNSSKNRLFPEACAYEESEISKRNIRFPYWSKILNF